MALLLWVVGGLVVLLALYAAYAYYAYHRVHPVDLSCRACASPVNVNGYDLYYREVGANRGSPPVVLLHGGPGHSSLSFKNSFDFLADTTRIVYYDQRGSGNSQSKPIPADYTVQNLVEELEALRRDVIKAERIVVIGHSFGAALAQRYALAYPARVAKLALIGGIRINNGICWRWAWKWLGPAFYAIGLGIPPVDTQAADAWFTRSGAKDDVKRLFDPTQARLLDNSGRIAFATWRELSLSVAGYNYRAELSRLTVPTLVIYGAADSRQTGKPVADELCDLLPNCTAMAFAASGHWPFLEEPTRFQKALREFLAPDEVTP